MKKPTKKRLVRGRDWHAWTWKCQENQGIWKAGDFAWWAQYLKGCPEEAPTDKGKWVKVKFVEVT